MDFVNGFFVAIGLDKSFFIQFIFVVVLYFILNKLLFVPYIALLQKRNLLTKGKFAESKKVKLELEKLKQDYGVKIRQTHDQFQKLFREAKEETNKSLKTKQEILKKTQADLLKQQKKEIENKARETRVALKKEVPLFAESLVHKLEVHT